MDEGIKKVAKAANKATKAMKEFGKAAEKANKMLKDHSKPRKQKAVVSVSEMKSTTLYIIHGGEPRVFYRRLKDTLEIMKEGSWSEVKITRELLMNTRFREY